MAETVFMGREFHSGDLLAQQILEVIMLLSLEPISPGSEAIGFMCYVIKGASDWFLWLGVGAQVP